MDVDEALVTLWDHGFDELRKPEDHLGRRKRNRARRVLGIATRREVKSPKYWMQLLGVKQSDFNALLERLCVSTNRLSSNLSDRAISRLREYARKQGIDRRTGEPISEKGKSRKTSKRFAKSRDFNFKSQGHKGEIRYLNKDEVLRIHNALVVDFENSNDPINPPGLKDEGMLVSACFRPQTAIGRVMKYETIESAGAALVYALVLNHPFFNGNKRTALVSLIVFMDENGMIPKCADDDLFKLVLQIAQHRIGGVRKLNNSDREVYEISSWICRHFRLIDKGERPLSWRKLKRILFAYKCSIEHATVGNRINISRDFIRRGRFGRVHREKLRTQVGYQDDGRDADVTVIKKIRFDLRLNDDNGVDSASFYNSQPSEVGDFVLKYRKILRRLAKL